MREKIRKHFILMGILAVMCAGLLTGCGGSSSISLMDYVTVEFGGVDGSGTAILSVDKVKMEQDMAGDDDGDISKGELEKIAKFTEFEFSINYELDKTEGLSNGDTVTVTVTYDKDLQKESGVKVKGDTSKKFKVEGLKEPVEVDAFDSSVWNTDNGVKVSFDGIAPFATLSIENNCDSSAPQSYVEYTADETSELENGDTVTITASLKAGAEDEGYILKETESTLTVEGLDSYVTDVSMLSAEDVETIESEMKDLINATYQTGGFLDTTLDGEFQCYTKDQIGSMSEPVFTDKGYAAVESIASMTVFPFNVDLNNVAGFAEEAKNYPGAVGYCLIYDLIITPDGELVRGDESEIKIGGIFNDEESMLNSLKVGYSSSLVEGTFAK